MALTTARFQAPYVEALASRAQTEGVAIDVLSLGPHIEVLEPLELRNVVADRARRTARLYRDGASLIEE